MSCCPTQLQYCETVADYINKLIRLRQSSPAMQRDAESPLRHLGKPLASAAKRVGRILTLYHGKHQRMNKEVQGGFLLEAMWVLRRAPKQSWILIRPFAAALPCLPLRELYFPLKQLLHRNAAACRDRKGCHASCEDP